jgi:hypothetical protein
LVVSGLNGRLDVDAVGGLEAVAPLVSETLEELDLRRPSAFWELGEEEVTVPGEGSVGWLLNLAWFILMSAPDVDVALTHKVLHHKRPSLFPLIDGRTLGWLQDASWDRRGQRSAWAQIHHELVSSQDEFALLEEWFAREIAARHESFVELTRLRIHDILLVPCSIGCGGGGRARGRDGSEESGDLPRARVAEKSGWIGSLDSLEGRRLHYLLGDAKRSEMEP